MAKKKFTNKNYPEIVYEVVDEGWFDDETYVIVFNEMTGMCNILTDGEIDFSVLVYDSYSDSVLFVSMNGEDTTEGFVHYLTYGY